ncbi:MATE family efflux transporter [Clostridiaceae bacterium M8S5]|nr:MATE family efflux transporter [Clostridiaceae bacterium M8S5]
MDENRKYLLTMSMRKLFTKLAIPGMIGMLAVGLYNMVDAIFVGQLINSESVGAITMGYNIVLVNQAILTFFATGAVSILSRAIGEKDQKTIDKLFGNVFWSVAILSLLLTGVVYFNASGLLKFIGAKNEILNLSERYIKIISLGFIFGGVGPALNMLIRGEGRMKAAMKIVFIGMIINIILDPIFISVFDMGIEGAAVATVLSQFIYLIGDIVYFKYGKSVIKLTRNSFKVSFDILPKMAGVGFSAMLMQIMSAAQLAILLRFMSSYGGDNSVIIIGAAQRIMMFAFIPMWGIGQGLQPVLGANFGAKNNTRVKDAFKTFTKIASGISIAFWLAFMILPKFILSWFITDEGLIAMGASKFRMYLCVFLLYGFMITSITLFQALGKGGKAAIIVVGRQILFFVPIALLLPRFIGEIGVWLSLPVSDLLTIILAVIFTITEFTAFNKNIRSTKVIHQ